MYGEYAKDPLMRLNLGIRRRLAPLLDNGRDDIELATAVLFSLPGSPILYYGDEIGMGDNIYLGDRDGVRTPMQWTGDRNGGFSRADFARLYLPPLMDPVYGLPGGERRGAAAHVDVAAALDPPLHRAAQGAPGVRLRRLRGAAPGEPARLRAPADASTTTSCCACTTWRARRRRSSSTCRGSRAWCPRRCSGARRFPRIGELPYLLTLAGPRVLLVQPEAETMIDRRALVSAPTGASTTRCSLAVPARAALVRRARARGELGARRSTRCRSRDDPVLAVALVDVHFERGRPRPLPAPARATTGGELFDATADPDARRRGWSSWRRRRPSASTATTGRLTFSSHPAGREHRAVPDAPRARRRPVEHRRRGRRPAA